MKMRNLLNLFSVATRKDWGNFLRWWTFGESLGCLFGLYPEDVASDKRLDVTLLFPLRCLLRLFCRKAWLLILKSLQVLACLVSHQSRKTTTLLALGPISGRWPPGYLVIVNELQALLTSYNVPLESLTSLLYARLCCSSNGATEDSAGIVTCQGRLGPGQRGGTYS